MVQGRRKVLVTATLENREENAYNTSLSLSFSRNLHLASFTPQVCVEFGKEAEKKEEERVLSSALRDSREGLSL